MQLSVELLFSAGMPPINTIGEPGDQGEAVAGMQGWGVKVPAAAAVAAATIGLAGLWQRPKGAMFIIGTWSMMLPTGTPDVVKGRGVALKLAGEVPIEQLIWAPVQHCNPIAGLPLLKTGGEDGTVVSGVRGLVEQKVGLERVINSRPTMAACVEIRKPCEHSRLIICDSIAHVRCVLVKLFRTARQVV